MGLSAPPTPPPAGRPAPVPGRAGPIACSRRWSRPDRRRPRRRPRPRPARAAPCLPERAAVSCSPSPCSSCSSSCSSSTCGHQAVVDEGKQEAGVGLPLRTMTGRPPASAFAHRCGTKDMMQRCLIDLHAISLVGARARAPVLALLESQPPSHRRDCHSAALPSPFCRCFNSDGERASAK